MSSPLGNPESYTDVGNLKLYMTPMHRETIDKMAYRTLHLDFWFVCLVDGEPGTGKTTRAMQDLYYLTNGKFDLSYVAYDHYSFTKIMSKCKKGDGVLVDEAFEFMNTRKSLSDSNMKVLSLIQMARFRNVFLYILLPSFYDLDKNIPLTNVHMLMHTKLNNDGERGFYDIYTKKRLRELYINGRKARSYDHKITGVKPSYNGYFNKLFPLDFEEYKKQKEAYLQRLLKGQSYIDENIVQQRNVLISELSKFVGTSRISELTCLSQRQVQRILRITKTASMLANQEPIIDPLDEIIPGTSDPLDEFVNEGTEPKIEPSLPE